MNDKKYEPAAISFDLKKYRIRIHKASLHKIGDPLYIQLLIDPEHMAVAIKSVEHESSGDQTHKVSRSQLESDNSYEIYSRCFFDKLCSLMDTIESGSTYRLAGCIIPEQKVAVFSLRTLKKVIN